MELILLNGSFLKFSPAIAVVTNIDREHLDFYKDLEAIKSVFQDFIDRIPFYGLAVLCLDNESIQDLIPEIKKRYTTYGMSSQADFQIRDVVFEKRRSRFSIYKEGQKLGDITLNLPGIHNVYNATASIAVGIELDVPFAAIKTALETLEGDANRVCGRGDRVRAWRGPGPAVGVGRAAVLDTGCLQRSDKGRRGGESEDGRVHGSARRFVPRMLRQYWSR